MASGPGAGSIAVTDPVLIAGLEGFVPDDGYIAIQRRVVAGELASDQAVQLMLAQAQATDRILALNAGVHR